MAEAQILPFEFTNFAGTLGVYLGELDEIYEKKLKQATSPRVPAFRPSNWAPGAWAASSMTKSPYR